MKLLVMSDNHHDWKKVKYLVRKEKFDFSIHLGDAEVSEKEISMTVDKYVAGNHDQYSIREDTFEIEGLRFGILHGHTYGISMLDQEKGALRFARENNVDVVLHGHIHIPYEKDIDGVKIICPGALSNPRSAHGITYMIIEVENGEITNINLNNL